MKIVGTIDLAQFPDHDYDVGKKWLRNQLKSLRKNSFESHERIIVVQQWDYYVKDTKKQV